MDMVNLLFLLLTFQVTLAFFKPDMHDVTIPDERICRIGQVAITRELHYNALDGKALVRDPTAVNVTLIGEYNERKRRDGEDKDVRFSIFKQCDMDSFLPLNIYATCTKKKVWDIEAKFGKLGFCSYGVQCAREGLRFWYPVKQHKDFSWTYVIIKGLTYDGENGTREIVYPINPQNEASILSKRKCIWYASHVGNVCERYVGHACSANSDCRPTTDNRYECVCEQGYRLSGRGCVDVDECVEGTHDCNLTTTTCKNLQGTYWCPLRVSDNNNLTTVAKTKCEPGFVDVSPDEPALNCVKLKVLTPQEVVCKVDGGLSDRLMRFIVPINDAPGSTRLTGNITVNMRTYDGAYAQQTVVCQDHFNLMSPSLVNPVSRYKTTGDVSNPESMKWKLDQVALKTTAVRAPVGLKCYSNGLLVWMPFDSNLQFVNVSGAAVVASLLGMNTTTEDVDYVNFSFPPNDPRVPKRAGYCRRVGAADNCKWASGTSDLACDQEKSFCDTEHPMVFKCVCKPGYEDEAGQCKVNPVCFEGFRLTNDTCEDEDECVDPDSCSGSPCTNTYGGFKCGEKCDAGYELNGDGSECVDVDECSKDDWGGCDPKTTVCVNLKGGSKCECKGDLVSDESGLSCSPPKVEYRLLDPSSVRCCSHTHDITTFMVKATLSRGVDFDAPTDSNRYSKIEPVSCIHVSRVSVHGRNSVAKPYVINTDPDGRLEEESVLQFVEFFGRQLDARENETSLPPTNLRVHLQYDDGCRRAVSTGEGADVVDVFVVRTPATRLFNDPRLTLTRQCKPLGANPDYLKELLATPPHPPSPNHTRCYNNSAMEMNIAWLKLFQSLLLFMFFLITN